MDAMVALRDCAMFSSGGVFCSALLKCFLFIIQKLQPAILLQIPQIASNRCQSSQHKSAQKLHRSCTINTSWPTSAQKLHRFNTSWPALHRSCTDSTQAGQPLHTIPHKLVSHMVWIHGAEHRPVINC